MYEDIYRAYTVDDPHSAKDEISMEVGCQASEVSMLLEAMDNDPMFFRRIKPEEGSLMVDGKKPGEGTEQSGNLPGTKPGTKPAGVGRAKAKAKTKARFAKDRLSIALNSCVS